METEVLHVGATQRWPQNAKLKNNNQRSQGADTQYTSERSRCGTRRGDMHDIHGDATLSVQLRERRCNEQSSSSQRERGYLLASISHQNSRLTESF